MVVFWSGHLRERKTHKHKQICGIVPELGGCQTFVYVFFFHIPCGGEKHINKIPPPSPGTTRKCLFMCFCPYVFFSFAPTIFLSPTTDIRPETKFSRNVPGEVYPQSDAHQASGSGCLETRSFHTPTRLHLKDALSKRAYKQSLRNSQDLLVANRLSACPIFSHEKQGTVVNLFVKVRFSSTQHLSLRFAILAACERESICQKGQSCQEVVQEFS